MIWPRPPTYRQFETVLPQGAASLANTVATVAISSFLAASMRSYPVPGLQRSHLVAAWYLLASSFFRILPVFGT